MKKTRSEFLVNLRPNLPLVMQENSSEIEVFMHIKLRPILKFQNDWILMLIPSAQHFKHLKFDNFDEAQNRKTISNFLMKNKNIRNQLLGGVSAMLTKDEFKTYLKYQNEFNKRIMEMIVSRFISNYVVNL